MVWVRLPVYFYKRNDTFYVSRSIPSDLQHRFKKRKIEVSLRTKSESKAAKSAAALSDRLERYWDSLRMEMIYSKELGLSVAPDAKTIASAKSFSITEALALYHRLKGGGKTKLLFESSERSMRYLIDCLGHDDLAAIEISDAGRFRDFLFDRGMSSSSVKRVFSSVRAVINFAIREQGLSINNVFSGTFIPDDETKTQRLPIPTDVMLTIQRECMQLDDEPRWLIALISDTGMRLSEACGLLTSDICLDGELPHIRDLSKYIITQSQLHVEPIPSQKLLIGGWMPEDSFGMVYANRGVGKSWFCMALAVAIAEGRSSFLGWQINSQQNVLYIDGEMAKVELKERFDALCSKPLDNLFIMPSETLYRDGNPIALDDKAEQFAIDKMLQELDEAGNRAQVIVLDNLSTLRRGVNENDNTETQDLITWLVSLWPNSVN